MDQRFERLKSAFLFFQTEANDFMRHLNANVSSHSANRVIMIQELTAEFYRVPLYAMTTPAKPRRFSDPRQCAMAICCEMTSYGLAEIGERFGGRDHGTIIHAREAIRHRCETDASFFAEFSTLRQICRSRIDSADMPLFHPPAILEANP